MAPAKEKKRTVGDGIMNPIFIIAILLFVFGSSIAAVGIVKWWRNKKRHE